MILVVDGPDASGKTTLSKKLEEILELPRIVNYQTVIGESGSERETYVQALSLRSYVENFEFILDRFLMTCAVYNVVFREGKHILRYLELMKELDIFTIYIHVPWHMLSANLFQNKPEEREDIKRKLRKISAVFERLYKGLVDIIPQKIILVNGLNPIREILAQLESNAKFPASWRLKIRHYLWRKRCRNR